jgi:hypothetical protein
MDSPLTNVVPKMMRSGDITLVKRWRSLPCIELESGGWPVHAHPKKKKAIMYVRDT